MSPGSLPRAEPFIWSMFLCAEFSDGPLAPQHAPLKTNAADTRLIHFDADELETSDLVFNKPTTHLLNHGDYSGAAASLPRGEGEADGRED